MTFQFDTAELTVNSDTALPIIWIKSLPAGSGKTRSIIFKTVASGKPTIITTPTDTLSLQYRDYFRLHGIEPVVVSREVNRDKNSHQHLQDACKSRSRVILVNRNVFHETNAATEGFDVFHDEFFDVIDIISFGNADAIRDTLVKLLDAIELTKSSRYYELRMTDFATAVAETGWNQDIIKNDENFLKLCKRLGSPFYRVYILANTYNKYKSGKQNSIQFWSFLLPTILRGTEPTIVGANGEDQFLFKLWSGLAVFQDADYITGDYDDLVKHLAPRKKYIKYVSHKKVTGSVLDGKTVQGKTVKAGVGRQRAIDAVADMVADRYHDAPHVIGFNNNPVPHGLPFTWKLHYGKQMQLVPHGQNDAKDRHLAVCLGAQYFDPATYKFLKEVFELEGDEVDRAFGLERLYQLAMRISARDKECDQPFTIIVWDHYSAKFLQEKFGGEIEYIDIGISQFQEKETMKSKKTGAERKAEFDERKRRKKNDHESTVQYNGFKLVAQPHKMAVGYASVELETWFCFGAYLEDEHKGYLPTSKKMAKMFREGDFLDLFKTAPTNNIQSTKLLIYDMDHIKGDPKALSDFLYARGWSHYIYNSYSSKAHDPSVRVVIGLSEAVNPANYLHISLLVEADIIAYFDGDLTREDIERNNVTFPIDQGKVSINHRFFNPSVSVFDAPLFIARHVMKTEAFQPKFLDVRFFLTRNPVVKKKKARAANPKVTTAKGALGKPKDSSTVQAIMDRWAVAAHTGDNKGTGSFNFSQAAVDLLFEANLSVPDAIFELDKNTHRFGEGGAARNAAATVHWALERSKSRRAR